MNDAITIRVANTSDAGNLCTFMSALITERLLVLFRRERYPTVDEIRALIGKMSNACYGVLLIAETQGTVVGMLDFHVIRDVRLSLSGKFGISVAHSWRRKGVATNLLRELLTWSESHDIRQIELEVFSNNHGAIDLYRKSGFALNDTKPRTIDVDGEPIDILQMSRTSS